MMDSRMQLIAEGRTAEVYAWKEGTVLKLFRDWVPQGQVEYEARLARAVHASGLPVPWVGGIVEVDGRTGLIYQRLDGPTLLESLKRRPWTLARTAHLLATLHVELHAKRVCADVPEQKRRLEKKIEAGSLLSPRLRAQALSALKHLPSGEALCHGDFHPGNVLITPSGPILIDWIDATRGHPCADVARTLILARFALPEGGPMAQKILVRSARWMTSIYLREYTRIRLIQASDVEEWIPVIAAARIEEGVGEAERLAELVESSFA
jgi:aminoglycoside phosphotransferase (APT) family kinase protein